MCVPLAKPLETEHIHSVIAPGRTRLKIRPKMRYRKLKVLKKLQITQNDQTDLGDQTTHSHWIQCEMGGGKTVKHEKLPIPSFDQSVCE